MSTYLLAIDQGTTSSRAIIFNRAGEVISQYQIDLTQYFPEDGWVEQDPEEMWSNTLLCCQSALKMAALTAKDIVAIGISNQRETTIIWDKKTGLPIYRAIVWQDRRTGDFCKSMTEHKIFPSLQAKTGLLLDAYFSASKIRWLLDNVPNARERAERGELAFGTVDTFLLWRLTDGKSHATDASNASRTLLFNIHTQEWDKDILEAFDIPAAILPAVLDNAADFGKTEASLLGGPVAIAAMAGDQQAATVGQACFNPGMIKITYGTGCFVFLNTGKTVLQSANQLLSTVAYRLDRKVTYGLEGSIFSAGTIVKWFRDTLKIIKTASETEELSKSVPDTGGVYLVPAFTGLGAPYWDPDARAALLGLTRNSELAHIVRAGLESVCYQSYDLLGCMQRDGVAHLEAMRVDGGMVVNNWFLQFLTDILGIPVQRPACVETSALGAVFLAGLQSGVYQSLDEISELWQASATFVPAMQKDQRDHLYQGWKKAVARVILKPNFG
ncbi:MAG: glycerol kinase GlpK [Gammaproteobacteria bacterium]|nr:glycerol kinase GlpK [Gammaproteobacteria bacterium]